MHLTKQLVQLTFAVLNHRNASWLHLHDLYPWSRALMSSLDMTRYAEVDGIWARKV